MPEPTVNYQPKPDDPNELLILTIEDGTNTVILDADEAVAVQQELTRVIRLFDLLENDQEDATSTCQHRTEMGSFGILMIRFRAFFERPPTKLERTSLVGPYDASDKRTVYGYTYYAALPICDFCVCLSNLRHKKAYVSDAPPCFSFKSRSYRVSAAASAGRVADRVCPQLGASLA